MQGNVVGTAAPVGPVTLVQGEDSTQGLVVGCMRDLVEVCTLARAADFIQAQAAECMLALEEVSILDQEVGFIPVRVVESILAHPPMMATKAHGGLASLEPKTPNGPDRTVHNEAGVGRALPDMVGRAHPTILILRFWFFAFPSPCAPPRSGANERWGWASTV
jgi:hypothetical protein